MGGKYNVNIAALSRDLYKTINMTAISNQIAISSTYFKRGI
jgi:hypothetical protein